MVQKATYQKRLDDANADAPPGCRFLIQLVDAKTAQDARREVAQMYGPAIAKAASIVPGTEQPPGNGYDGNEEWKPSPDGFTVYVPIGTKI